MKNYILILIALLMIGCGIRPVNNNIDNSEDSINLDKLNDTLTPTMLSGLNTLIDTLYGRVQSEDIDTRVNTQLAATYLVSTLARNYLHNTQIDTALVSKMADKINLITGEWCIQQRGDKKLLSKEILHGEDIFQIIICINEQSNDCFRFMVAFPRNAQSNPTLMFSKNDFHPQDSEHTTIYLDKVLPADSIVVDNGQIIALCDPKIVAHFLNNAVVYIGYTNDNENEKMENRFEIGRLRLARFQEQYNELVR